MYYTPPTAPRATPPVAKVVAVAIAAAVPDDVVAVVDVAVAKGKEESPVFEIHSWCVGYIR